MDINDLPLPTNQQIEEIAERIGSIGLDCTDVNTLRLCALIIHQDKQLDSVNKQ